MVCKDFDVTGYWRIGDTSAANVMDNIDKNKLCTCWLSTENPPWDTPELFCKPKEGCGAISKDTYRTAAIDKGFMC